MSEQIGPTVSIVVSCVGCKHFGYERKKNWLPYGCDHAVDVPVCKQHKLPIYGESVTPTDCPHRADAIKAVTG